jgi:hypothetical protein
VDYVETTNMLFSVDNDTCSAHVTSTSDHNNVPGVKFDKFGDFVLFKVEFYGVVDLDSRIRVTYGAAVVGDNIRNTLGADGHFPDFEQLVGSLFWGDPVDGETALDVVKQTEMFARFFNGDNIWKILELMNKKLEENIPIKPAG